MRELRALRERKWTLTASSRRRAATSRRCNKSRGQEEGVPDWPDRAKAASPPDPRSSCAPWPRDTEREAPETDTPEEPEGREASGGAPPRGVPSPPRTLGDVQGGGEREGGQERGNRRAARNWQQTAPKAKCVRTSKGPMGGVSPSQGATKGRSCTKTPLPFWECWRRFRLLRRPRSSGGRGRGSAGVGLGISTHPTPREGGADEASAAHVPSLPWGCPPTKHGAC